MPVALLAHPGASQSALNGSFESYVSLAAMTPRGTRDQALDYGIDETALLQYASGAVSVYERRFIQSVLVRNEWAMKFVVDAIKRRRCRVAARVAA